MANKTCTWLDITLKWIGLLAIVVGIAKVTMKYMKHHYHVLPLDLGNQLGI